MDHAPPPIPHLARPSTIAGDFYSISSGPLTGTSPSTAYSFGSPEYPRAAVSPPAPRNTTCHPHVPSGLSSLDARTPGTQGGPEGKKEEEKSMFVGASPSSTPGHHASTVTLGAGVFARGGEEDADGQFDPERSMGKLVGELERVVGGEKISSRPTSPFSPYRSPTPINNAPPTSFFAAQTGKRLPDLVRGESSQPSTLARDIETRVRATNTASGATQAQPKGKSGKPKSRPHTLRTVSAPVSRRARSFATADMSGLTELLKTPAGGGDFGVLGSNVEVEPDLAVDLPGSLAAIKAKLKEVETENTECRRRARELETELERYKREITAVREAGVDNVREVVKEKTVLEDLVSSTRTHLARLTVEVEQQKAIVDKLHDVRTHPPHHTSPNAPTPPGFEMKALRFEVTRLSQEIGRLHTIVEQSLDTCKTMLPVHSVQKKPVQMVKADGKNNEEVPKRVRVNSQPEEIMEKVKEKDELVPLPSRLRQGLRTAASQVDCLAPPTPRKPPAADSSKAGARQTETVLPSRLRQGLFTAAKNVDALAPSTLRKTAESLTENKEAGQAGLGKAPRQQPVSKSRKPSTGPDSAQPLVGNVARTGLRDPGPGDERKSSTEIVEVSTSSAEPKTKLALAIRGLEEDFWRSKRHYAQLADKYKRVDPSSDPHKRQHLAELLREAIDEVGKRADRIEVLKSLLEGK